MSSMTSEQRRAFFAKQSFQESFVSKKDLEKTRKQHNELTFLIKQSEEKERFYEGRIQIEKGHQQRLQGLRSRL